MRILKELGVDRRSVECRKILNKPLVYCRLVEDQPYHTDMVHSMIAFAALDLCMNDNGGAPAMPSLRETARKFVLDFMEWCQDARESIYLHILGTHLYRWPDIGELGSSHAIEKINHNIKQMKQRTRRDPKTLSPVKSAAGQLTNICRLLNARCLLRSSSPVKEAGNRDIICSACNSPGHNCRNSTCPKASPCSDIVYHIANKRIQGRNKRPSKRRRL